MKAEQKCSDRDSLPNDDRQRLTVIFVILRQMDQIAPAPNLRTGAALAAPDGEGWVALFLYSAPSRSLTNSRQ
jgi:hypothetical protein